jgi:hypothetical protein
MATAIEREFVFLAGVHFEGKFLMNAYSVILSMDVMTESIREQNIAMERIKCLLQYIFTNTVFVQSTEKKAIEKYTEAGIKVCVFPEEPYDQVVTLLLLLKINAITEGRLEVTSISMDSELSDGVRFVYDYESAQAHSFGPGWWDDPSPSIVTVVPSKKEKIVKLVKTTEWTVHHLDWKDKIICPSEIKFTMDNLKS